MIASMTWAALSGFSTSSTYPFVAHALPPYLDKSEYAQCALLHADPTSRSLRCLGERAVIPTSSHLAGCGSDAARVAAPRTNAIHAPRGWRVGGGDPGGCGVGLVGFNVCGTAGHCGDE